MEFDYVMLFEDDDLFRASRNRALKLLLERDFRLPLEVAAAFGLLLEYLHLFDNMVWDRRRSSGGFRAAA